MVGILTPEEIDSLLEESQFARLACHANGKTYVVPISYAMDGDRLLGQTTLGLKIEMMRQNPEVCLVVDQIVDLTNWRSVIAWGRFEELSGIEAAKAEGILIDKYEPVFQDMDTPARRGREVTPPRVNHKHVDQVIYCIHLGEKTGRFESP